LYVCALHVAEQSVSSELEERSTEAAFYVPCQGSAKREAPATLLADVRKHVGAAAMVSTTGRRADARRVGRPRDQNPEPTRVRGPPFSCTGTSVFGTKAILTLRMATGVRLR
jgi:hypothetical protein